MDTGLLASTAGLLCLLAGGVIAVVGVAAAVVRRWLAPDPEAVAKALARLGYERRGERWTRGVDGIALAYDEPDGGLRWTARLPRYQAVDLRVEERGDEWPPVQREGAFLAGDPDLDARFRFLSERSAPALELLATDGVGEALLALPAVEIQVRGNEVIVRDPGRKGLRKRLGGDVRLTGPRTLAAQVRVHEEVAALALALAKYRG